MTAFKELVLFCKWQTPASFVFCPNKDFDVTGDRTQMLGVEGGFGDSETTTTTATNSTHFIHKLEIHDVTHIAPSQ